jgi:hypothetical protein
MALKPENWEPELESRAMAHAPQRSAPHAQISTFQSYIPATQAPAEFTTKAILLGAVPLSFLHHGTGGLIAGGLVFFALGVVLAEVGQGKLQ